MEQENLDEPLSGISTLWGVVNQAHEGEAAAVTEAQQQLLQRYDGAVHRYLLGALHDRDAADELAQEFALRFLRGDFRRAAPGRGRFRDYVKTVLIHLVADYHRGRQRSPRPLPPHDAALDASSLEQEDADRAFLTSWRDELLERTWQALARVQQQTGQPFYAALRLRAERPTLRSDQMAEQLAAQLGRPVTAGSFRQILHRARNKFADLLLLEVAHTLEKATLEPLEQELIDLGLLSYCGSALARFRRSCPMPHAFKPRA
jgi:RNA polymerase sigma-70 factor (ECF subfamily)